MPFDGLLALFQRPDAQRYMLNQGLTGILWHMPPELIEESQVHLYITNSTIHAKPVSLSGIFMVLQWISQLRRFT